MVINSKKSCCTAIVVILLNITPTIARSSQSWQQWEDFRWAGLEQFRKNKLTAAQKDFEQALTEAKRIQPGGQNEAVSIHDLAQVYDAEGKIEQAETYCKAALQLSRRLSPNSTMVMLILQTLEDLKSEEAKYDEVRKLDHEMNELARGFPDSRTIGAATMDPNGSITVKSRLEGADGSIGDAINTYAVTDTDYKKILMHIGPLKPGDGKLVTPLE